MINAFCEEKTHILDTSDMLQMKITTTAVGLHIFVVSPILKS